MADQGLVMVVRPTGIRRVRFWVALAGWCHRLGWQAGFMWCLDRTQSAVERIDVEVVS